MRVHFRVCVSGGCEGKARPCVPACVVPNSVCSPAGVCACAAGFGARFAEANRLQSHRLLRACVDMSQVQVSQAHQALDEAELQARFYYPSEYFFQLLLFSPPADRVSNRLKVEEARNFIDPDPS